MRGKAIFAGSRSASCRVCLSLLSLALGSFCGCSLEEFSSSDAPTVPNAVAVDRALDLCSLTHGDQPFHLVLEISPPTPSRANPQSASSMHAQVELYWLNALTYRTVIYSRSFSQTRIVNAGVVEEHNTGDFYPRWIQNFVDALLDPVPRAASLRRQPGSVPVSRQSHACISSPAGELTSSQVCFQDAEPRLASGTDFTRYVSFDDFAPFGSQQIPRTLINDLPANFLVRGRITLLEPLPRTAYRLLKAREYTQPAQQIRTTLVSKFTALALLDPDPAARFFRAQTHSYKSLISYSHLGSNAQAGLEKPAPAGDPGSPQTHIVVYVRTDRTGRVREAYRDSADIYGLHNAAVARALTLRFKPLLVNGVPQQMEAPLELP